VLLAVLGNGKNTLESLSLLTESDKDHLGTLRARVVKTGTKNNMLALGSLGEVGELDALATCTLGGLVKRELAVVLSGRVLNISIFSQIIQGSSVCYNSRLGGIQLGFRQTGEKLRDAR
jgi:hypothetical protein